MIISISGAGSTGKTTLVESIMSDNIQSMTLIGELVREIFSDEKYQFKYSNYSELLDHPEDILEIQMDTAVRLHDLLLSSPAYTQKDNKHILLLDRSPIDILIYLRLNMSRYPQYANKVEELSQILQVFIDDFMSHEPYIFYTIASKSTPVEIDGFRPKDLIERRSEEIDIFNDVFSTYRGYPRYVELPDGVEKRKSIIYDYIKEERGITI